MELTFGNAAVLLAVIGLVVLLLWFPSLMGLFIALQERLGRRLEEQRQKRERKERRDE